MFWIQMVRELNARAAHTRVLQTPHPLPPPPWPPHQRFSPAPSCPGGGAYLAPLSLSLPSFCLFRRFTQGIEVRGQADKWMEESSSD